MRRLINILLLLAVYVLVCGKSCQDESGLLKSQEDAVKSEKEDIRNEFEVPYLSEESRYASELAAIQKLADLPDLLAVYTDPDLDTAFRNKAAQMIRSTFISEKARLLFDPFKPDGAGQVTTGKFLRKESFEKLYPMDIRFDSIQIAEPLHKETAELYRGFLACTQHAIVYGPSDTSHAFLPVRVEMYAVRTEKVFGKETLHVWEPCLGDMMERK